MRTALAVLAFMAFMTPALAVNKEQAEKAIVYSQAALGRALPDLAFTDTEGRAVALRDFRGKPLLVTLIYTSCADVCPTLIASLYPAVKAAMSTLGSASFAVITVGFDLRNDSPARLRSFARTHGVDLPNWHFLAADAGSLEALAKAVGFGIYSRTGGFDHLAQISVVDAEGRLRQQIYGAVFEPPLIVEPLKSLILGRGEPVNSLDRLVDRIRYFCTVYDPGTGKYYFDYTLFVSIAVGLGCFSLILIVLIREWRRAAASGAGPH